MFPYHCLVVDLDDFVTGMYPGALVGRALESDVSYHVGAVEGEGLEPDPEVHGVVIGLPFGCRYVQASRLQSKKQDWSQRELKQGTHFHLIYTLRMSPEVLATFVW